MIFEVLAAFNDGGDVVLQQFENMIEENSKSDQPIEEKYDKLLRMVVGMRATITRRQGKLKEEMPAIDVPPQQIILPS